MTWWLEISTGGGGGRTSTRLVHKCYTAISNIGMSKDKTEEQVKGDAAWVQTKHNISYADNWERDKKEANTMGSAGYYTLLKIVTLFCAIHSPLQHLQRAQHCAEDAGK